MSRTFSAAVVILGLIVTAGALAQQKGGGDETGPYDLVAGWPQNYCGDGHVIGSTAGIWAESPDRVYIFSRGCLPVLADSRGAADSFIPARNASGYDLSQKDPTRHPRWDHVFNVVDRNGKLIESWEQHNKLFVRPHRILVNPYDADRHVWLVDEQTGTVRSVPVQVGKTLDGERIVVTGLAAGQLLVSAGVQRLAEGQAVRVPDAIALAMNEMSAEQGGRKP